jgi:hypothetical protein
VSWKGHFQQGVVECNLGDLPSILIGFRSGNNISRPLAYYSCTFWASPRFGGFFATFCELVLNLAFLDEQFAFSKLTMQNQATILLIHDCNLIYGYGRS